MPASTTHRTLTKYPRWFENQTRNRPPDRVNSNPSPKIETGSHEGGDGRQRSAEKPGAQLQVAAYSFTLTSTLVKITLRTTEVSRVRVSGHRNSE